MKTKDLLEILKSLPEEELNKPVLAVEGSALAQPTRNETIGEVREVVKGDKFTILFLFS